jgi:hypothetical protein
MGFILLMVEDDYDFRKRRFKSTAFEPYDDRSGISVFDRDCALSKAASECEHADRLYHPPIPSGASRFYFWHIEKDALPKEHTVAATPSTLGDDCHREIRDLTKDAARRFFRAKPYERQGQFAGIFKCDGGQLSEMLSPDDAFPPQRVG